MRDGTVRDLVASVGWVLAIALYCVQSAAESAEVNREMLRGFVACCGGGIGARECGADGFRRGCGGDDGGCFAARSSPDAATAHRSLSTAPAPCGEDSATLPPAVLAREALRQILPALDRTAEVGLVLAIVGAATAQMWSRPFQSGCSIRRGCWRLWTLNPKGRDAHAGDGSGGGRPVTMRAGQPDPHPR